MTRLVMLISLAFIFSSFEVVAQDGNCFSQCLARGGLTEHCNEQCGIVTHGSINVPKNTYQQTGRDPLSNIIESVIFGKIGEDKPQKKSYENREEAFASCYENHCRQGRGGLPLEQCIENCTKITVLDSSGGRNVLGTKTNGEITFQQVNFDCFRACRTSGDSIAVCKSLCVK